MKINRFVALAVIALLVVAAMGFISTQSHAQTSTPPAQTSVDAPDRQEAVSGPDTDNVEEQVGDQSTTDEPSDTPESVKAAGEKDARPDQQTPSYGGSITVDQAATDGQSETAESTALAAQAKITVEQAKAAALAANPGTTVTKAELDNENGALVYSVELSNGADVKVDASNGAILHTDTEADSGEVKAGPDSDNVQEGEGQQVEDGQPDLPGAVEAPEAASQSPAK